MLLTFSFFLRCAAENRCLGLGSKTPNYMSPVQPGSLYQLILPADLPPAEAPNPLLTESEVVEGPLPPVAILAPPPGNGSNQATPPTKSNAQLEVVSSVVPSFLAFLIATLALFWIQDTVTNWSFPVLIFSTSVLHILMYFGNFFSCYTANWDFSPSQTAAVIVFFIIHCRLSIPFLFPV